MQRITNWEQISVIRVKGPPGGVPVNVVVVSNRVARAKPDEPLAGGLAAALLPMVRDSGAIWVGSSGQSAAMARGPRFVCSHRGAWHRRAGDGRHPGQTLSRLLRRFRQFSVVAGAAFARRPHSRQRRRLCLISRSQRVHGARPAALQHARDGFLDPRLSLSDRSARSYAGSA